MKLKLKKILFAITILIFGVLLGFGAMWLAFDSIKTESINLPNKLNSTASNPIISFKKTHKISINGQQKSIWNSYQTQSSDFVEGRNVISVQRESKFGLKGIQAEYIINVDRIAPELKIGYTKSNELVNQKNVTLQIDQELRSEIYLGDKIITADDGKIDIPLFPGENIPNISIKDEIGNITKNNNFKIMNLVGEQYQQVVCDDLLYTLDTTKTQIGYSGVDGRPEVTPETDIYFADLNKPKCSQNKASVSVYPKGAKAICWNCDGGYTYINLYNTPNIINKPRAEKALDYPNVISASEYTTKSGITGDLVKQIKDSSYVRDSVKIEIKNLIITFEFSYKGTAYQVVGNANINNTKLINLEQDFMFFIDHLYSSDFEKVPNIIHSEGTDSKEFKDAAFNGFKFNYKLDWKISIDKDDENRSNDSNVRVASNRIIASKGPYTVYIQQTAKNGIGTCGTLFDDETKKSYKEIDIDGEKLQMPFSANNSFNTFVLKEYKNEIGAIVGKCNLTIGDYDYQLTVYTGNLTNDKTKFDLQTSKELFELLDSIKWAR
jgi:hypothetical protein